MKPRVTTDFFAAHRQYAFPVQDRSPEDVMQGLIRVMREHPKSAALHFTRTDLRAGAKVSGAENNSLGIMGWQHVFTESKIGLANKLAEKWLSDGNLIVLSP